MKLIEALKSLKYQLKQADMVSGWLQSHSDCLKEVSRLNYCILKTNVLTKVSIEIGGVFIEKSIAEWILRRKKLAAMEESAWKSLTDRGLKEGMINQSSGTPLQVKIRRYYDPKKRDEKVGLFSQEPSIIDAKLEIVNC